MKILKQPRLLQLQLLSNQPTAQNKVEVKESKVGIVILIQIFYSGLK